MVFQVYYNSDILINEHYFTIPTYFDKQRAPHTCTMRAKRGPDHKNMFTSGKSKYMKITESG